MASKKTEVIRRLFFERYDPATGELSDSLVKMGQIARVIREISAEVGEDYLNTDNIANFWKDLTRRSDGLDKNWPEDVAELGYWGSDAIGQAARASFAFIPLDERVISSFTIDLDSLEEHEIQSLSMPVATKALGRRDENWLAQVSSWLRIVEAHFALMSNLDVREVTFLQTGVKLRRGEADAVYSLKIDDELWLVSVEAKGLGEDLNPAQLARAAVALEESYAARTDAAGVIPFLVKIVGTSLIYTAEFDPVVNDGDGLHIASHGLFRLVPDVDGIS